MFIYFILHLPFESENVYLHLTNLKRLQPSVQASLFRELHNSGKFPVALTLYTNILKLHRYSLQVHNKLVESTRKTE